MAEENKTDQETPFSSLYPNTACPDITCWTRSGRGWIELRRDEYRSSTVRVLDIGGLLWETAVGGRRRIRQRRRGDGGGRQLHQAVEDRKRTCAPVDHSSKPQPK
jgi:hypothetical protein